MNQSTKLKSTRRLGRKGELINRANEPKEKGGSNKQSKFNKTYKLQLY